MRLSEAISGFVLRKRDEGRSFCTEASILHSFLKFSGNLDLDLDVERDVLSFLNRHPTTEANWSRKCRLLIQLITFWSMRDACRPLNIPLPRTLTVRARTPHLYTERQIRSLLETASSCQKDSRCRMPAPAFQTLIVLLYATGMTIREAIELRVEAFHSDVESLTVYSSRYRVSRTIPICPDLRGVLEMYLRWKANVPLMSAWLLVTSGGHGIRQSTLIENFQRLRSAAFANGPKGASFQPRLRDMRTTFAVNRITAWIGNGGDLNRLLPALAVYMGLAGLDATHKYMALAPERFRSELNKLSPAVSKARWGEDEELMEFLKTL